MAAKGQILCVGGWDTKHDVPVGWVISGADIGLQLFSDGRPALLGGYTVEELRAIYEADVQPRQKGK